MIFTEFVIEYYDLLNVLEILRYILYCSKNNAKFTVTSPKF